MNEYTASNGIPVKLTNDGRLIVENADHTYPATIAAGEHVIALREFFRAEEDERLGRWRSPQNPGYLVHVYDGGRYVWVSKEIGGNSLGAYYRNAPNTMDDRSQGAAVARAYFDAHPEPKPWHDATPGEVWALTFDGRIALFIRDEQGWNELDPARSPYFIIGDHITAGRRIYPEVTE